MKMVPCTTVKEFKEKLNQYPDELIISFVCNECQTENMYTDINQIKFEIHHDIHTDKPKTLLVNID